MWLLAVCVLAGVCVCLCVCAWRMLILELPPAVAAAATADVRRVRVGHNNDTFAATGVVYLRLLNASQLTVLLSLCGCATVCACWCVCDCVLVLLCVSPLQSLGNCWRLVAFT